MTYKYKLHFHLAGYLQLFASILIVLRHYSFFMPEGPLKEYFSRVNYVEIFFLLSGFFIFLSHSESPKNWSIFLLRRFQRIYPTHLVTTLFFVFVVLARDHLGGAMQRGNAYGFSELPFVLALLHSWNLTGGHSYNYPTWYLSAQFAMYVLFVPVFSGICFFKYSAIKYIFVLVLFSLLFLFFLSSASLSDWLDWTYDYGALRAIPSFFSGILVGLIFLKLNRTLWFWGFPVLIFFLSLGSFLIENLNSLIYFLVQLVLFVSVIFSNPLKSMKSVPMKIFGVGLSDLAFGIFMFHVPVATVILSFLRVYFFSGISVFFFIFLSIVISVFVSIFWFRYMAKLFDGFFLRLSFSKY